MWEPQAWPWFKRLPTFRLPRNAPLCPLRPLKLAQNHRLKVAEDGKTRLRVAQPAGRMACARLYCDAACLKPESLPVKDTVSWQTMQSHRWLAAPKTRTRPKNWRSENRGLHTILSRLSQAVTASCCHCSVNSLGLPLNSASAGREDEQVRRLRDAQWYYTALHRYLSNVDVEDGSTVISGSHESRQTANMDQCASHLLQPAPSQLSPSLSLSLITT